VSLSSARIAARPNIIGPTKVISNGHSNTSKAGPRKRIREAAKRAGQEPNEDFGVIGATSPWAVERIGGYTQPL
jgi:hypothetical protein